MVLHRVQETADVVFENECLQERDFGLDSDPDVPGQSDEKERHGRSKPAPIPEQAELSAPEQEQSHDDEW